MFGRATITLGIGPHSSIIIDYYLEAVILRTLYSTSHFGILLLRFFCLLSKSAVFPSLHVLL